MLRVYWFNLNHISFIPSKREMVSANCQFDGISQRCDIDNFDFNTTTDNQNNTENNDNAVTKGIKKIKETVSNINFDKVVVFKKDNKNESFCEQNEKSVYDYKGNEKALTGMTGVESGFEIKRIIVIQFQ